ncbi:C-14 sterol reductase Erg24 [Schizosaccharomyces japonicus yFS275]|uniref:Delta(14)-sterol reductase n=1 Tax=Schizosaccharomyces japonicus (strain yFS275 / FY16936) TaxID=402676 RepID=B6K7T9_SCHJY|nr:C-14 sterol reductase Erg24 [Schizosaccharomyces japonicus yFS275]EEB09593.1 C-14 sterol reductase Erg24 [Schizosaccharomyces japonicus yFS275]
MTETQRKPFKYEFFGPIGAAGVVLSTTLVSYGLYFMCNENGCPSWNLMSIWNDILQTKLFDWNAMVIYLCWFGMLALLWFLLPGKWVPGSPIDEKGTRLLYKMNGFKSMLVILFFMFGFIAVYGPQAMEFVWTYYVPLLTASYIFSVVLCTYCYLSSFVGRKQLAKGGVSGNAIYDWYIGRELNPRLGLFDLKVFCELRPGLILWVVFDIAFACHQIVQFGRITDSMVLVVLSHSWYVVDSLVNESAVLTTMDVTTDGFGYMLSFGDLVWVPFTYSLQARYLAFHPVDLGFWCLLGIVGLQLIGYSIFRGANGQKNKFRTNPNDSSVQHLKYIQTKRGTKLLTSGWWGIARHINYFGDWIMAWAWCLPTGFGSFIPYFYVAYFAVLLIHRDMRDEEKCQEKYGEDWNRYCKLVKWHIVPGVY